jgi:hypothetical protein
MTDTYKGYPTDLLVRVKNMGRGILGDDALYDAAQEYTDPAKGGGNFGPALLAVDCTVPVTPAAPPRAEAAPAAPPSPPKTKVAEETDPWAGYEVHDLKELMKASGLTPPRVLTAGRAIKLLEAAGVKPT